MTNNIEKQAQMDNITICVSLSRPVRSENERILLRVAEIRLDRMFKDGESTIDMANQRRRLRPASTRHTRPDTAFDMEVIGYYARDVDIHMDILIKAGHYGPGLRFKSN